MRYFNCSCLMAAVAGAFLATDSHATVVESWDFENASTPAAAGGVPTDGMWFTDTTAPRNEPSGSNGTLGVNGTLLRGYNEIYGPQFDSDLVSATGGSFAMDTVDASGDAYLTEGALHNWSSNNWSMTLEVYLDAVDGWETIVGRDGSTDLSAESDFYLQRKGIDSNELRLNYVDADGNRHVLDGTQTIQTGQWYDFAIVVDADSDTISMYIDGALEAQLTGQAGNLGIASSTLDWTFGRGWYNGNQADWIDGHLDNITFYDQAIVIPEPGSLALLGLGGLLITRRRRA